MKIICFLVFYLFSFTLFCQITVDNSAPFDSYPYLVNNVLLGNGVQASNVVFQGDSIQIGFFDGSASNIGFNSGIVMSTGDIAILNPNQVGIDELVNVIPPVTDPDLLNVANSVPALIGQNFTVSGVNDIAVLEFDFVPSSDTVSFRYVFASQEYFGYENSAYNDVFGFFISGPGIVGPYASPAGFPNGSINIATFESQEANSLGVELPITVSSICNFPDGFLGPSVYNPQLFINNQNLNTVGNANGFTVVMTATAAVQCGETYHIRLAIADGTDTNLSSYIFLEENSFKSSTIVVNNNVGQDSTHLLIDCGSQVILTAQVESDDEYTFLWSTNDTTESILVSAGMYSVVASNGDCQIYSDTIVVEELSLEMELVDDFSVCEGDFKPIGIKYFDDGQEPYTYLWSTGQTSSEINVTNGTYSLIVTDANNCITSDTVTIHPISRPKASIYGDGIICKGKQNPVLNIDFVGVPPFYVTYTNGNQYFTDTTLSATYQFSANELGDYSIFLIEDNNCVGTSSGISKVSSNYFDSKIGGGGLICPGDSAPLLIQSDLAHLPFSLILHNGNHKQYFNEISNNPAKIYLDSEAIYTIDKITDALGCESVKNSGSGTIVFKNLIEPIITTKVDSVLCQVDPPIELYATPSGGVWSGKGVDFENTFTPINGFKGDNWIKYSFPINCNETDSFNIIVDCESYVFIPNTFTPNGDSENEKFRVEGFNILTFEMYIFNRWGEQVFYTNEIRKLWDGTFNNKIVPTGVYAYNVNFYGKDGAYHNKKGTINVIK